MALDHSTEMARIARLVETRLAGFFPGDGLREAMRYSLLAGGKRIRPILTVQFCRAAGGREEDALDFACGVEMLHTYSLIHDDLPCMDNDDLRRGKPTCHKVFGECVATLAGDALQAAAFETVLSAPGLSDRARAEAALALAEAAGDRGMCGGQYYDTEGDGQPHTEQELTAINAAKTGALLRAACRMGVLAASDQSAWDSSFLSAAEEYAAHLGLAFQIQDDILDATSTTETLGKPVGSDASNAKSTYWSLLGPEVCKRRVEEETSLAKAALERIKWPGNVAFLGWLADKLAQRSY